MILKKKPAKIKLIALDPATRLTGYAVFEESDVAVTTSDKLLSLERYGLLKANTKDFEVRCILLVKKFIDVVNEEKCTHMIYEFPEFQQGMKGQQAARGGATIKLAYLCGCLVTAFHVWGNKRENKGKVVFPVGVCPSKWKGQLPKIVSAQRCEKQFGIKADGEREYNFTDAIELGKWWTNMSKCEVLKGSGARRVDL